MLESKMLEELKTKLKFERCNIDNIETGSTEVGVPDWHIRTETCNIWIEAKEIKRWPTWIDTKITIKYRPGQFKWLRNHKSLGGRSLIAVTFEDYWFILEDIRKDYTIDELTMLSIFKGPLRNVSGKSLLIVLEH